jgi:hypothetical protein
VVRTNSFKVLGCLYPKFNLQGTTPLVMFFIFCLILLLVIMDTEVQMDYSFDGNYINDGHQNVAESEVNHYDYVSDDDLSQEIIRLV